MVASLPLCIPSILLNREGVGQSEGRESVYNPSYTKLANATLVQSIARNVSEKPNASPSNFTAAGGSTGKSTPSGGQPHTEISGLENLRKNMASEGISTRATELIAGARRTGSIANYESAWRKWASWCNKQQVDPLNAL